MTRSRPRRSGFTLLEVILAMAIVVVAAALTIPAIETAYAQQRAIAGGDAIKSALLQARAQAVEDGVPYRVAIVVDNGNFRVAPDIAQYWEGQGDDFSSMDEDVVPYILEESMPEGVLFPDGMSPVKVDGDRKTKLEPNEVSTNRYSVVVAVFLPDGSAREDKQLLICGKAAEPLVVSIRSLTGEVVVSRYDGGR